VSRAKSKVPPHVFVADPDVPPDPLDTTGRRVCAAKGCHLPGAPGDSRHTMPDPVPDVRQYAAGEGGDS